MIEYQKIIFNPKFKNFGIDKHGALCNELKELYTAMTRARKKLIIYDKNYNKGKKLKEMWRSLNLIDFISDEDFHINDANPNNKVFIERKIYFFIFFNLEKCYNASQK